jgi:hypothetical protein
MENAVITAPQAPVVVNGPDALLLQAIQSGVTVEVVERLLALKERMEATAAKQAFNKSMADFQAECPVIKKTKAVKTKSGAEAYRYAPIESVVKQVKDIIQNHGFRYSTSMEITEVGVKATCRVTHALGHSEDTPMEVPLGNKTDIMSQSQVVAAAQTFAKRYAFLNAFGIMTADEDTDGPSAKEEKKIGSAATQSQKDEIDELAQQAGLTKAEVAKKCRENYGVSITDISSVQAQGIIGGLKTRLMMSKQPA